MTFNDLVSNAYKQKNNVQVVNVISGIIILIMGLYICSVDITIGSTVWVESSDETTIISATTSASVVFPVESTTANGTLSIGSNIGVKAGYESATSEEST